MPELKTLNGYEIVDAKARQDIANIQTPDVPTKVSAFENDAGYLTAHQDISGKADKAHTHTLSDVSDYTAPDLEPYAKKSDLPSLDGYATEKYVDEAVANVSSGGEVNLDNYYTKGEVDSKIDAIDIPEVDFTGYATEAYVNKAVADIDIPVVPTKVSAFDNDKGYLTQHQSLDGYATRVYVDNAVASKANKTDIPDTSTFATKNYVNSQITDIREEIPDVSDLASKTYVNNKVAAIPDIDLSDYASKAYVDNAVAGVEVDVDLSNYATKSYVINKVDSIIVPTKVSELTNDAEYATETFVNEAIANIDIPEGGNVDLDDYYTKAEVDAAYTQKGEVFTKDETYNRGEIDARIANAASGGVVDLSNYYTKSEVDNKVDDIDIPTVPSDVSAFNNDARYATEQFVNDAIANIDIPEGGSGSTVYLLRPENTVNPDTGENEYRVADDTIKAFAEDVIASNGAVTAMLYIEEYNGYLPVAISNINEEPSFYFGNVVSAADHCSNNTWGRKYRIAYTDGAWQYILDSYNNVTWVASSDLESEVKRHHLSIDLTGKNPGDTGDCGEIGDAACALRYTYTEWNCTPTVTLKVTDSVGYPAYSTYTNITPYSNGVKATGTFIDIQGNTFCRSLAVYINDEGTEWFEYNNESVPSSGGTSGLTTEEVQAMIDASLGVIENGSY